MALVKCPECGREISDQAVSCPGCGAPGKKVEAPVYQLSVPKEEYKSNGGSYLRLCGYATWVLGGIASIVSSLQYGYNGKVNGFNFWMFLLLAAVFFVVGIIPICFAQFFDDVHTIRCALQGMTLTHDTKKTAGHPKTSVEEVYCTKCNKYYAKYYTCCPVCGQKN